MVCAMRKAVLSILFVVMLLAVAVIAEAQQPTKIPRIGYLGGVPCRYTRTASRHSGRVCASLGTWREKTLSLSTDMPREN